MYPLAPLKLSFNINPSMYVHKVVKNIDMYSKPPTSFFLFKLQYFVILGPFLIMAH